LLADNLLNLHRKHIENIFEYKDMNILELSEQEIGRRQSLQELRDMGIDPYPAAEYPTNAFSTDILAEFKDEDEPRQVCIAGRMMSRRVMGKASFIELQDSKGRVQVYITRDDICPGEQRYLQCPFQEIARHWRLCRNQGIRIPHTDRRDYSTR
jgi:lysyl-tRNA synthetase class II